MTSLTVSPPLKSQYLKRLEATKKQAEGLKKSGDPNLVSGFLEASITSTIESYEPGSELRAYATMVKNTAHDLHTNSRADLAQNLWENALTQAAQGIPGGAGIALAKSLQHMNSGLSPADQGITSMAGIVAMRIHEGQSLKGEEVHATVALDACLQTDDLAIRDIIGRNAIDTIASLEDWKFAG